MRCSANCGSWGPSFPSARDHAFQHVLCQELAATNGDRVDKSLLPGALNELRLRHGLEQPASVESWLAAEGLDLGALAICSPRNLTTKRQRALLDAEIERVLVQQLRLSGRFRALEDRAKDKQAVLSAQSSQYPDLKTSGINEDELWAWYFGEHLKLEPSPTWTSIRAEYRLAEAILRREILREWLYQKLTASSA